jgi:CRISPR-associated protein Cas6
MSILAKHPDMNILLDRISEELDNDPFCSEEFGDYLFPVEGTSIAIDHAHSLYGSICRILPEFHEHNSIGIFGINGKLNRPSEKRDHQRNYSEYLNLNSESYLRIRLPIALSRWAYKLAGKTLHLNQDKITLGIPDLELIMPSDKLEARIVTIKGFQDVGAFITAAQNHLNRLEIAGRIQVLTRSNGQPRCRTVRIHNKKVVGFAVRAEGLNNRDSLILQQQGIGGRRKLGCGLFIP